MNRFKVTFVFEVATDIVMEAETEDEIKQQVLNSVKEWNETTDGMESVMSLVVLQIEKVKET